MCKRVKYKAWIRQCNQVGNKCAQTDNTTDNTMATDLSDILYKPVQEWTEKKTSHNLSLFNTNGSFILHFNAENM